MNVMLHLGLGSFHRAHQAVYLHETGDRSWTLAGGNLRGDMLDTIAALQAQDGAYTLETISPAGEHHFERITSITQVIGYTPDLAGLIAQGAHADTKIISFTVTEAGYYLDAHNQLDRPSRATRHHNLWRVDRDSARTQSPSRRPCHLAQLRQPQAQRGPFAQRLAAVH